MLKRFVIFPSLIGVGVALGLILINTPSKNENISSYARKTESSPPTTPFSFADAVANAAPSVVNLYNAELTAPANTAWLDQPQMKRYLRQEDTPQRHRMLTSLGSGVIVHPEGFLLTNYHVVAEAKAIIAALSDGREAPLEWVGFDPETDLAILKIKLPGLKVIGWADENKLRVGDSVLAIGNPFGIGQTVTRGVVSAINRSGLNLSTFESFIQTDAAINPGNSGGALINVYGELVGINTALFSQSGGSQGIGFAIPGSIAKKVLGDIVSYGQVIRGWLGLYTQPLGPTRLGTASQETSGLLISGIAPQSPAHAANLQVGDILLAINNTPIKSEQHSKQIIAGLKPGMHTALGIRRDTQTLKLFATIGLRPSSQMVKKTLHPEEP